MDNNFNPYITPQEGGTPPIRRVIIKPNYFELFSFGFAIASLFSCTIIYTAYLFGGLAILFALLSRGARMNFSPKAKKSLVLGIIGIILATVLFITSFLYLLQEYGSLEEILRIGSEEMGIDFEEEFGILFQ